MPGGCKRARFSLAISHRDSDDEVRIVERRSVRMGDGVPEFAAFVNRTRSLRRAVRADSPGKRELPEEFQHACFVTALIRINLGVMPLEIAIGERGGGTVAGAGNIHDV